MLNYIHAEFYKLLRRKYTYIALGVCLVLESLLVAGYVFTNAHGNNVSAAGGIVMVTTLGAIGFCACLLTGDIVFAGQYKHSTMKNEVSFGLSRARIYLGKLIVQTALSIAYMVIMIGFYVLACWLFLYQDPEADLRVLQIVGYFLAVGFPLWIGAQAAACMCQFLVNGDMAASFVYMGLVFMLHNVIDIVRSFNYNNSVGELCTAIFNHMPSVMVDTAGSVVGDWTYLGKAWLVGAVWLAVCTAAGLWGFRRKEIK